MEDEKVQRALDEKKQEEDVQSAFNGENIYFENLWVCMREKKTATVKCFDTESRIRVQYSDMSSLRKELPRRETTVLEVNVEDTVMGRRVFVRFHEAA